MLRPLAEARQELNGHQVKEAFKETADAVLGAAEPARPMGDLNFADAVAARRRQDGDEAVQVAIETHFAEDPGPIAPHAAIIIVQSPPRKPTHKRIEYARRQNVIP